MKPSKTAGPSAPAGASAKAVEAPEMDDEVEGLEEEESPLLMTDLGDDDADVSEEKSPPEVDPAA